MSATNGYTIVPRAVSDSLQRGEINATQFAVLFALYLWADHATGRVDSFCAERVCRFLHIDPTAANSKSMRRQIGSLRSMGWFHWDYVKGSKRPYHVWLHNYVIYLANDAVHENDHETVHDGVPSRTILNPCEITPYQNVTDFDDDDSVRDTVHENSSPLSTNNHVRIPSTVKNTAAPDPAVAQADDLLSFIYEMTGGFTRPQPWALRVVRRYPVFEVKYALAEWMWSNRHDGEPSTKSLGFFFKEGYESVINARRLRYGSADTPNLRVPSGWDNAMEVIKNNRETEERYQPKSCEKQAVQP